MASNVLAKALPGASGSFFALGSKNTFYGYSGIKETGGSAAVTVNFRANNSASGPILASVVLAASGSTPAVWFGPQGIDAGSGVYVQIVGTGVAEGSGFVG